MGVTKSLEKLAKSRNHQGQINLNRFDSNKENSFVYGSNAKCWFRFNDGRVLFKSYDNPLESYGEVLYCTLAKKYGINCAKYDFATYKDESGTISYDVAFNDRIAIDGLTLVSRYNAKQLPDMITKGTKNLEVISMLNKRYNNYESLVSIFEKRYPDDAKSLETNLIKTFVLDVLLDHADKNLWNIMIVTNEYGYNAELYSIDSSHIACLYRGEDYIKSAINSLLASDGTITIEDYLQGGVYGYDVDVKGRDYNPAKDLIDFYYNGDEIQREMIANLVKEIDINQAIEEVGQMYKVDPIIETWIKAVFNSRKSFLLKKFYHINDNYRGEHTKKNFNMRNLNKKRSK